jgi:hypothetical protein
VQDCKGQGQQQKNQHHATDEELGHWESCARCTLPHVLLSDIYDAGQSPLVF